MTEKKSIFGKLLGKVLGDDKKTQEIKKPSQANVVQKKSPDELKKEEILKAAQLAQKKKDEEEAKRKAEIKTKEEEYKGEDEEDETPSRSSFGDKFKKEGIKKPKSLKEIADEAEQKREETKGKSFSDGDAAKKDIEKAKEGHSKFVKKKTKKALEGKVFLIRGKDNGRPAWHYVLVSPDKIKMLRQQKSGTNIDVTDFGNIIRSGWGENPSDEIVKEIEEEYGD